MSCARFRRGKWVADFRDAKNVRRWITLKHPGTERHLTRESDEGLARKLLAQFEVQVMDGKFSAKSEQRNFQQLVDSYLESLRGMVRKFTRTDYESTINTHLKVYFGTMKLRTIAPSVVEEFRAWMQDRFAPGGKRKLSPRTVNKSLTTLSQILNHAEKHRWVDYNPCKHVKKVPQLIADRRRRDFLLADECQRLINAAGSPRDAVLFRMAIETGMRQGELLGLRRSAIDLACSQVIVERSCRRREASQVKSSASKRTIDLTPTLVRELKVWLLACPKPDNETDHLVFPNAVGGFEDAHNLLRRGLHRALDRAGLERIRFHDLRRTCASLLFAGDVPLGEISAQLGHSDVNVTARVYVKFVRRPQSPGAKAFHAILGGSGEVAEAESAAGSSGPTHGSGSSEKAVPTRSNVVAIKSMPA